VAVVTVRFAGDGRIEGPVDLVTRGVLDDADVEAIKAAADRDARAAVLALTDAERANPALSTDAVRLAVRRVLTRATGSKPEVVVVRLH
jgi:mRNA degradation ribonuclease J1/J2